MRWRNESPSAITTWKLSRVLMVASHIPLGNVSGVRAASRSDRLLNPRSHRVLKMSRVARREWNAWQRRRSVRRARLAKGCRSDARRRRRHREFLWTARRLWTNRRLGKKGVTGLFDPSNESDSRLFVGSRLNAPKMREPLFGVRHDRHRIDRSGRKAEHTPRIGKFEGRDSQPHSAWVERCGG